MRKFITIVENTLPKTKTDLDIAPSLMGDQDVLVNRGSFAVAPASATQNALSTGSLSPELQARANAMAPNILRDLEAMAAAHPEMHDTPTPTVGMETVPRPTIENLPAVIQTEIARTDGHFNPTWHQVRNLPGMMLQGVRMMGRAIFGQFTDTPIEDIQMMTDVFSMNPEVDVRKMMKLITTHGEKNDELNYDFSEMMPAYQQLSPDNEAQLWRAFGYEFLLMKDIGGHYVYAWPESDKEIWDHTPRTQIG